MQLLVELLCTGEIPSRKKIDTQEASRASEYHPYLTDRVGGS